MHDRDSDVLGNNGVSCRLEYFCRSPTTIEGRGVFFPDLLHGESVLLGLE